MKYIILFALLMITPLNEIDRIARTNELKKEAKAAFQAEKYEEAINKYHFLLDSMKIDEEVLKMNLANAYYQHRDTTSAISYYNQLRDSENSKLASKAYQQLGVIKNKQKNKEEALENFKQALRKDPANEEARYNYELLKKLLDEEKKQQEQEQKEDKKDKKEDKEQQQKQDQQQQQNQDQKDQEKKEDQQKQDQEGKEGEEQEQKDQQQQKDEQQKEGEEEQKKNEGNPDEPTDEENKDQKNEMNISPDKLKEMNISEEKARMILEAMKNQEIQYLQQNKRKAQKRPNSSKPDW